MHDELDQPPVRVHQGMALAPLHLLACIVAARTAGLGRLDALAVDHRRRWAGASADPLAILHDQVVVDPLPGAVVAEPGEPAIHRQEWREPVWQHVPGAPGPHDEEDRLDDAPHRPLALASARARWRQQRFKDHPFGVRQVASIAQRCTAMLPAAGRGPHAVSRQASNTRLESHLARPANPDITRSALIPKWPLNDEAGAHRPDSHAAEQAGIPEGLFCQVLSTRACRQLITL